ncbi:MAG: sulfurtransferase complex subunit TusB [Enterovibrio sp.]
MLHLVKQSPFASDAFANSLRYATADDAIVLLQDAVLALLPNSKWQAQLQNCACKNIFALQEDVFARAVFTPSAQDQAISSSPATSSQNIFEQNLAPVASIAKLIDMDELVDLTVQYENSLTW